MIRVAFIGVSHSHLPICPEPVRRLPDVTVAGVSAEQAAALAGNPGIHFADLIRYLSRSAGVEVLAATTASSAWNPSIEDYALVTLRAGTTIGTVETGCLYPSSETFMDMHYSLRTPVHYFVARDSGRLEVSALTGGTEVLSVGTTNISYYPRFVEDVLRRFRAGEAPVTGLREAAEAMSILGQVYQLARPGGPGDEGGSHAVG